MQPSSYVQTGLCPGYYLSTAASRSERPPRTVNTGAYRLLHRVRRPRQSSLDHETRELYLSTKGVRKQTLSIRTYVRTSIITPRRREAQSDTACQVLQDNHDDNEGYAAPAE